MKAMKIIDRPDRGDAKLSASARGEPFAGLACYGLWRNGLMPALNPFTPADDALVPAWVLP